jgi:uncharacterized protein
MNTRIALAGCLLAVGLVARADTPSIQATGSATIKVQPDQASLSVGVVTQATTAQEAAQSNATQAQLMIAAVTGALGKYGTIQTTSYTVSPRYSTSSGQTSTIVGYTASNTLQVTTTNLNLVGTLIDTAYQAGANSIGSVSFGLQDSQPTMQQALGLAAKQALAYASAIATGLGARTGTVLAAVEGGTSGGVSVTATSGASSSTPIQSGTVSVTATVTLTVQLVQ